MRTAAIFLLVSCFCLSPALAQEAVEKEPNNAPAQAMAIALGSTISGFANEDEDDDWYALTIPAPGLDAIVLE